ncbi:unnamed protein product [Discula destructiva]
MVDTNVDLAEVLAMLLPTGLVFEDPAAYAKLADQPVVPWEDIHKLWNNSTSRYKKFQDPTSCRLEHFWWHVWASDRRNLSGKTLARLWESIVNGTTIAPLIGPPRPYPIPHTRSMHESDRMNSSEKQDPDRSRNQAAELQGRLAQQNLTPSSSRPPPAHPILKKPRGPSNSGPRPTARFADVPDSEDETTLLQSSDSQQTGSGSGSGTSKQEPQTKKHAPARSKSPAKGDRKPAKKFVASKATGKRRPVLPRRQSSQSSNGSMASESSAKDGKASSSSLTRQPEFLASPNQDYFSEGQESLRLPQHDDDPVPNAKALGKLPAKGSSPTKPTIMRTSPQPDLRSGSKTAAPKRTSSPLVKGYTAEENSPAQRMSPAEPRRSAKSAGKQVEVLSPPGQSANPLGIYGASAPVTNMQQSSQATTEQSHPPVSPTKGGREAPKTGVEAQTLPIAQDQPGAAPQMARTRSQESKRMSAAEPVPSSFFKSPSVVGMSKFAVKGGFDFETPKPRPSEDNVPPLGMLDPDIPKASVLDSKFSPTQPSPTPVLPLARSKSQLTLLLERDKERSERNKTSSGSGWHRGDGGKSDNKK